MRSRLLYVVLALLIQFTFLLNKKIKGRFSGVGIKAINFRFTSRLALLNDMNIKASAIYLMVAMESRYEAKIRYRSITSTVDC